MLPKTYEAVLRLKLLMDKEMRETGMIEWDKNLPGIPGAQATYENGVLQFRVDDIPYSRKVSRNLEYALYRNWIDKIVYAYYQARFSPAPFYEKALVTIIIKHNESDIWDVDNRVVNAIVNAVRTIRVVADDDYQHLAYMVTGQKTDAMPRTLVYVNKMPDLEQLIPPQDGVSEAGNYPPKNDGLFLW